MTAIQRIPSGQRIRPPRSLAEWMPASPVASALARTLQLLCGLLLFVLLNLVFFSQLQNYLTQANLYGQIRVSLAGGAVPVGPTLKNGKPLVPGTPVAVLSAPSALVAHEVIVEGTSSGQTMQGIGHERDSALPCQVGVSTLMARSGSYGGVGFWLTQMRTGQTFTVAMGEGTCAYQVVGFRSESDPVPHPPTGKQGQLRLITAGGLPFLPTSSVVMDARLVTNGFTRSNQAISTSSLLDSEAPMAIDTSNLFATLLLLELLLAVTVGFVWMWRRWGRWQAWIVGAPVVGTVALLASGATNFLFPNLL